MTEDEFREATLSGYGDIMILKAIAEKENYTITPEELNDVVKSTAEYIGLTSKKHLRCMAKSISIVCCMKNFFKT